MGGTMVGHTKASTWRDLERFYRTNRYRLKRWIFRGEGAGTKVIESKLELACKAFGISNLRKAEFYLLREFKRHYFRLVDSAPRESDTAEWLSVIRHYGGPTRLVDWTYSFWVAVYFAAARARVGEQRRVWLVEADALHDAAKQRLDPWLQEYLKEFDSDEKDPEFIDAILDKGLGLGVWGVNPFRLNERLAVQQGTFLAATNLDFPFWTNLLSTARQANRPTIEVLPLQFEKTEALRETLTELRAMGVTQRALFGGVEGLAQGLTDLLASPHVLWREAPGGSTAPGPAK